jgi:hypothetical protein
MPSATNQNLLVGYPAADDLVQLVVRVAEAIQATPGQSSPERVNQRTVPSPAASLHPLAKVTQVSHILGAAANR